MRRRQFLSLLGSVAIATPGPASAQSANRTYRVGLFNRGPESARVSAKCSDLGLTGAHSVRDIWLQKDLGRATNEFSAEVPRHGVVFVRLSR